MALKDFAFKVLKKDKFARCGLIETHRGNINTPAFMPVGTQATVKACTIDDIKKTGSEKPLFTPNSLDFLVIYLPTRDPEQLCYLTVPIPPIHLCKSDYVMPERIFIPVFALIRHCRACNA